MARNANAVKTPAETPAAEETQPQPAAEETQPQPQPAAEETPAAEEQPAAEETHALDISALAAEEISKAQRVYIDVPGCPRVPTADGTIAVVQREQRADGTLGEFMLAEIRVNTRDKSESVNRMSIARIQALKVALDAAGVRTLR